jgi:uncharacterized protein
MRQRGNAASRTRYLWCTLLALLLVLWGGAERVAFAGFTPPAIAGPVTDPGAQLTPSEHAALARTILGIRAARGYEIAVFLPASLEGDTIDDVAYHTFRTWKLGFTGKDDGVLLVIATRERKVRIETGKGVGGALTDLQANQIIRERIGPRLKRGELRAGIQEGIDAIDAALATDIGPAAPKKPATRSEAALGLVILAVVVLVPLALFILIAIWIARVLTGALGRRGGYSSYGDSYTVGGGGSSWSSSSSDSSFGSGGGSDFGGSSGGSDFGGGDFGGGGGDTGGGGSSGDY